MTSLPMQVLLGSAAGARGAAGRDDDDVVALDQTGLISGARPRIVAVG